MTIELIKPNTALPAELIERLAQLRAQAEHAVETWQPEPNEALLGVITGHQKVMGTYGENFQVLVQSEDGSTTGVWITPWLRDNLKVQCANVGDLVALTFLGKKQSPNGRIYNGYSLIVSKTPALDGSVINE